MKLDNKQQLIIDAQIIKLQNKRYNLFKKLTNKINKDIQQNIFNQMIPVKYQVKEQDLKKCIVLKNFCRENNYQSITLNHLFIKIESQDHWPTPMPVFNDLKNKLNHLLNLKYLHIDVQKNPGFTDNNAIELGDALFNLQFLEQLEINLSGANTQSHVCLMQFWYDGQKVIRRQIFCIT
ncbi:hypothetical protein PPERSA_09955 [Pseudocohnilembus persalinus]|uniref:Uncharacterized protein n=1 Tax=Pseudocohnilembus persalinus TaxID=266149 RepID=A0A0V0QJG3_PSEPJ|nr:hypothetical protein PPERSA_09955 [Pseudocohnilembus persalinus]|eukprot:KRX02338.1 hypothetical protein PPERSA_09955 [Pseudocohnilembus persalinus]